MLNKSVFFRLMTSIYFMLSGMISTIEAQTTLENIEGNEYSNYKIFDEWDQYYNEKYLTKGYDKHELRGTGYYPYERYKHQYFTRNFKDGTVPDLWEEQVKIRRSELSRESLNNIPDWESLGPNTLDTLSGRMISMAFHPQNSEIILAGAGSGGLWKTENGGETWEVLSDNLPSLRISSIAINPINANHIIIGTGNYMFPSFALQPGFGLLESFDGGLSWQPNSFEYEFSDNVSTVKLIWDKIETNRVYMAASNGLWASIDSGASWTNKLPGIACDLVINKMDTSIIYTAIESQGIYKSTNFGNNWTLLTGSLPPSSEVHRIGLAISDGFPDHLVTGITDPNGFGLKGVFKTSDGGTSWIEIMNPPAYVCQPSGTSCQGWFVNQVAISPVDTDLIFLGGVQFWRTDDGGNTWTWHDYASNSGSNGNSGLTYVDCHEISFDPIDPNIVYVLNDGGIQKSEDSGLWWERKSSNLVTAQCYLISTSNQNVDKMLVGSHDHGLQSFDGAEENLTWHRWSNSDGTSVFYDPNNDNIAYGDILFGKHVKSLNGGTEGVGTSFWMNNGITDNISTVFLFSTMHHPYSSNILYTSTDNFIYKTTNGNLWNPIANIPFVKKIEISPVNSSIVYAASWDNSTWAFYRSNDDGNNWQQTAQSPGWRITDVEADPLDEYVVYATRNSSFVNNPHVYKSTDAGETWTSISNGLPDVSTNTILIHPLDNNIIFVGTDLGVFISIDKGINWSEYNGNLSPFYVMDLQYQSIDNTLRISTLGRGIWKTDANPNVILSINDSEELSINKIEAIPNPFNKQVNIYFEPSEEIISIAIYNVTGQMIYTRKLTDEECSNGTFMWNSLDSVNNMVSSGQYFITLVQGHYSKSIIVIKK